VPGLALAEWLRVPGQFGAGAHAAQHDLQGEAAERGGAPGAADRGAALRGEQHRVRHAAVAQRLGAAHGTITVLVSHRFSSVHMADQIIVMDGGRVAESGSHAALLARGGLYAELFSLQAQGYVGEKE
jgi:ATP-binding cassette subfamily B protein